MPRPILIQPAEVVASAEKKDVKLHGANPATLDTLRAMSANRLEFLRFCDDWESGKASIRTRKREFEEIRVQDFVAPDKAITEAWTRRPVGCNSLKHAVLLRIHTLRDHLDNIAENTNTKDMTKEEIFATLEAGRQIIFGKLNALKRALKKRKASQNQSMMPTSFPYAFGCCRQQEARDKIIAIERKLGGPMEKAVKNRRFPEQIKGWPFLQETDANGKDQEFVEELANREQIDMAVDEEIEEEFEEVGAVSDVETDDDEAAASTNPTREGLISPEEAFGMDNPTLVDRRFDAGPLAQAMKKVNQDAGPLAQVVKKAREDDPEQKKKAHKSDVHDDIFGADDDSDED